MKTNSPPSSHGALLNRADKLGSLLSSLCAVHCMCMPVLIGLLPMIGLSFLGSHKFEHIACITMILLAAACVWSGCRVHRKWGLLALLGAGAVVVLYTQFGGPPDENETRSDWHEAIAMFIGGALIATSHLINLNLRARCRCAQCNETAKKAPICLDYGVNSLLSFESVNANHVTTCPARTRMDFFAAAI